MGHKFSPKLSAPLKDQILANLLRIKSQGSNIQHIKLFDYSIDIFNFEDGSIKLEEQFGSEFLFGYKKFFDSIDEAIDYFNQEKLPSRPLIMW